MCINLYVYNISIYECRMYMRYMQIRMYVHYVNAECASNTCKCRMYRCHINAGLL